MGNTPNIPSHQPQQSQQNERISLKNVSLEAKKISQIKELDQFCQSIICRILAQKKQKHLIQIIKRITDKQKIQQFLNQIHQANIQILDSFYQHIGRNWFNNQPIKDKNNKKPNILPPFDRQIGICGSIDIMRGNGWQPISQKYAEIVDLSKGISRLSDYQIYKQKGLQAIRKQQVCFIILAGGKNVRYDLGEYKQCDPILQLPSGSSLIQLLLKKLQTLGRLIQTPIRIFIMVDDQQRKKKIRKIKNEKIGHCQFIRVDFLTQINYGCLDFQGKLVVNDQDSVYFHPNGNGDIWGNFQGKNYQRMQLNNYKYFQIFGISNMLEHCFDCFMIGKLIVQNLPWITMATQTKIPKDIDPVIYINKDKSITVRDPQQIGDGIDQNNLSQFPYGCKHIFLNNTVFSGKFLQKAVSSQKWLQFRKYHCKRKSIHHRQPLSKYSYIFTFQRQLTDIFSMTHIISSKQKKNNRSNSMNFLQNTCQTAQNVQRDTIFERKTKGAIVLMDEQQYYSPFYTKIDKIIGAVSLSQIYKKWLQIKNNKPEQQEKDGQYYQQKLKQVCQIDSFISLQGQNLQQTIQELKKLNGTIQYPLYISQQNIDHMEQVSNTQSSIIINRSINFA